tara:strand:- start:179 stop:928 length:750 start_codon:yes stop_codon:yes gene_type:complete
MFRIIGRLDLKFPHVVKGINLEGTRKVGNPYELAEKYYRDDIDELIIADIIASHFSTGVSTPLYYDIADNIFVPTILSGGVSSLEDFSLLLKSGADRVGINTAAINNPMLINSLADKFGKQAISIIIQYFSKGPNKGYCFFNSGRDKSPKKVVEWAREAYERGAGEIILTCIDKEGMCKGCDLEIIESISDTIKVPLLIHGGIKNIEHIIKAAETGVSGVIVASALHYNLLNIKECKQRMANKGFDVRL